MVVFMNSKAFFFLVIFGFMSIIPGFLRAQISGPGHSGSDKTSYPVFNATDSIFVFCTQSEGLATGVLRANTILEGTKTFLWEKYNPASATFEFQFSESVTTLFSEIRDLADGCYRATITQGENTIIQRAWVFNNWITSAAEITESNCDWFKLNGEFTTAELKYYDLSNNIELTLFKDTKLQWKVVDGVVATVLSPQIFNPPTQNTDYILRVYDKYNCEGLSTVNYVSIVTKANFTVDKQNGEAPLVVKFTNTSENGTPGAYEWFFFRNLDDIKKESEGSTAVIDSIEIVAYDDAPVYTYENTGTYMVKLVSKKITGNQACVDTFYLENYILIEESLIEAPNVFTPNGDGTNDMFVIKFKSMQSLSIDIFNRWGKRIHHWQSGDVRGFEGTWTETVWDGRGMGGKYASPGVYYYAIKGEGRDGVTRRKEGFFHLFRDKD
jgi:gliding motility-associated-like protein